MVLGVMVVRDDEGFNLSFNIKKYSPDEEYFLLINAWRIVRVCEQNVNRIFCVLSRVDHV